MKSGGIHTRVVDGWDQAVKLSCQAELSPSRTFPSLAVPSLAFPSLPTMLAGPLLSRASGARSMPPTPAENVPPGPHRRHVNSCPMEREGGYRPILPDFPGGYRPPGRLLLQQQQLSSCAGFWLTSSVCMCVCVCVFIKLHITAQSGLVILVILCHSH